MYYILYIGFITNFIPEWDLYFRKLICNKGAVNLSTQLIKDYKESLPICSFFAVWLSPKQLKPTLPIRKHIQRSEQMY